MALLICACSYRYETLRCVKTKTVPRPATDIHESVMVQVHYDVYLAFMRQNNDTATVNNRALRYILSGDVNKGAVLLQEIVDGGKPAVLNNYGVALILQGRFDSGHEHIYKAATLRPDNPYFRKNYLYLHEFRN